MSDQRAIEAPNRDVSEAAALAPPRGAFLAFAAAFSSCVGLEVVLPAAGREAMPSMSLLGTIAVIIGIHRHRPIFRLEWWLFAAALATEGTGPLLEPRRNALGHVALSTNGFLSCALLLAAVIALSSHLVNAADWRVDLVDGLILLSAAGILTWQLIVEPLLGSSQLSGLARVITALHPALDALLVVVVLRIVLDSRRCSPILVALLVSIGLRLGAEVVQAVTIGGPGSTNPRFSGLLDAASAALIGLIALHPSMATLTTRWRPDTGLGLRRGAALGLAMLVCPITAAVNAAVLHHRFQSSELVISSVITSGLVVLRMRMVFCSQRAAERALTGRERRLRGLIENLNDLVLLIGVDGSVLYQSPSVAQVLGFAPKTMIGDAVVGLVPPSEEVVLHSLGAEALKQPGTPVHGVVRAYDATGAVHSYEMTLTNRFAEEGIDAMVAVLRDITERHRFETALREQALRDSLTGLPNRALFLDRAEHLLEAARRDRVPVTVLFIDLDNFKTINDGLGHRAGDQLLVSVATRTLSTMRGADTVCRLGGDEFVVLLDGHTTTAPPELMAARLQQVLRAPFEIGCRSISITASVGLASGHDIDVEELVRRADIAMYQAKASGKDATVTFADEMQADAHDRLQLEIDLRSAIEHDQLAVLYQPTIDVCAGVMTGIEALVRWDHPTRGRLTPKEFIAVAEESGLIVDIGRYVLREACSHAARWCETNGPLSIAVNISTRQLESDRLIDDVRAVLGDSGLGGWC